MTWDRSPWGGREQVEELAALLPFEQRYELRRQCWLDGPHQGWEAFDRALGREVRLNIAHGYTDLPEFIRAARTSSSFRHPSFQPVLDIGIAGGSTPYFTTPPVLGRPLDEFLDTFDSSDTPPPRPFPLAALVGVVRDACRALEEAHRRGLVHRQLNPDSLLVEQDFRLVIGVAAWEEIDSEQGGGADMCRTIGFPAYMSPEQIAGERSGLGPPVDVFGLGGMLHLVLFGTPPNAVPGRKAAVEILRAIADRSFEPRRPGTIRPEIRSSQPRRRVDALVAICLKALAYERERRHVTAGELGDELDDWLRRGRSWWGVLLRR